MNKNNKSIKSRNVNTTYCNLLSSNCLVIITSHPDTTVTPNNLHGSLSLKHSGTELFNINGELHTIKNVWSTRFRVSKISDSQVKFQSLGKDNNISTWTDLTPKEFSVH